MVGIGLGIFITITCIEFFASVSISQCLTIFAQLSWNFMKMTVSITIKISIFYSFVWWLFFFWLVHFFMAQSLYWTNGFLFSRSFYKVLDLDSIGDHPYDLIPWKRVCSKFYKCCRCFLRGGHLQVICYQYHCTKDM